MKIASSLWANILIVVILVVTSIVGYLFFVEQNEQFIKETDDANLISNSNLNVSQYELNNDFVKSMDVNNDVIDDKLNLKEEQINLDAQKYNKAVMKLDTSLCDEVENEIKLEYCHRAVMEQIDMPNKLKATVIAYDLNGDVNEDVKVISDIEIHPILIENLSKNRLNLSFDILNNNDIANDLKYTIAMYKLDDSGNKFLVDGNICSGNVDNVESQQLIHVEDICSGANGIYGDVEVVININNAKNFKVAGSSFGLVKLNKLQNEKNIFIDSRKCFLKISTEKDIQFQLMQGIDFNNETEELNLRCESVFSNIDDDVEVFPRFIIQKRIETGDVVDVVTLNEQIHKNNDKFDIDVQIPTDYESQAYFVTLDFVNSDGKSISNTITFRYVVQGKSANIQSIFLDKKEYEANEKAIVSIVAAGNAADFPNSRMNNKASSDNENLILEAVIVDGQKRCSESFKVNLEKSIVQDVVVDIDVMCKHPEVSAVIKNADNIIIASETNGYIRKQRDDIMASRTLNLNTFSIIGISVVSVVILFSFLYKKRKSGILPMIIVICLFGAFGEADAVSFGYDGSYFGGYANIDASTYACGTESLIATVGGYNFTCDNLSMYYKVWYQIDGTSHLDYLMTRSANNWRELDANQSSDPSNIIDHTRANGGRGHTWYYYHLGEYNKTIDISDLQTGNHRIYFLFYQHNTNGGHNTKGFTMVSIPFTIASCPMPSCGTANDEIYSFTTTGYGSDTQCINATTTNNNFPSMGSSEEWYCNSDYEQGQAGPCSASLAAPLSQCGTSSESNGGTTVNSSAEITNKCATDNQQQGSVIFNTINGKWEWDCAHQYYVDNGIASSNLADPICSAPSCLTGDLIKYSSNVYLKENLNDQTTDVSVVCNDPTVDVCCDIKSTDPSTGTVTTHVCTADTVDKEIFVASGTKSYPTECYIDDGCEATDTCPKVEKDFDIATMCAQRECNAQGICQATPVAASDLNQCASTCNSNADCSSGRIIETRP